MGLASLGGICECRDALLAGPRPVKPRCRLKQTTGAVGAWTLCSSASLLPSGQGETSADGCRLAALPSLKQESGGHANMHSSLVRKPGQTDPRKGLGSSCAETDHRAWGMATLSL